MPSTINFDFRDRATREGVGLAEGERRYSRQPAKAGEYVSAEIRLADRIILELSRVYLVSAIADGPIDPPTTVVVYTRLPDDDAAAQLRSLESTLDLDPEAVARGVAIIARGDSGGPNNRRYLSAPPRGDAAITVGVSREGNRDDTTLSYQFFWGEVPDLGTERPWESLPPVDVG